MLQANRGNVDRFGIITPFQSQKERISNKLLEIELGELKVGTAELFQGSEREVIILSTVRQKIIKHKDRKHLGFLSDPKRLNVMLTRAKYLLIIIGNAKVLDSNPYWNKVINWCKTNNTLI